MLPTLLGDSAALNLLANMSDKYKPPLSLRVWTTMLTNDAMRMSNEEKLLYDLFPLIKKI